MNPTPKKATTRGGRPAMTELLERIESLIKASKDADADGFIGVRFGKQGRRRIQAKAKKAGISPQQYIYNRVLG